MTPFCNLPEGYEHNAAIRSGNNPESISKGIEKIMFLPENEGLKWENRDLTW